LPKIAKSEGTKNYAQKENFQKSPKIAETEGTKNYAQNKTSEKSQKKRRVGGDIKNPPKQKFGIMKKQTSKRDSGNDESGSGDEKLHWV
jgi:hypothetical protein